MKVQLSGSEKQATKDFEKVMAAMGLDIEKTHEFEGVYFGDIRRKGGVPRWQEYYELIGIQLQVFGRGRFSGKSGQSTVQRRVMADELHVIDTDKIQAKFDELKIVAAGYKAANDVRDSLQHRSYKFSDRLYGTRNRVSTDGEGFVLSVGLNTEDEIEKVLEFVKQFQEKK
jgi:hypothetical protein